MGPGDIATWGGVLVALVLGGLGLLDAERSRRLAKEANEQAQSANRLAADAVRKAGEANEIAERANQLSEDANAVSKRTASQQEEDWFVEWAAEWDNHFSTLTLRNRGRDAALEPTVVMTVDDLHKVYRLEDDVAAGSEVVLPFDEIREPRIQHYRDLEATQRDLVTSGIFYVGNGFHPEGRVVVRWRSGLGLPGEQVLELQLS